MGIKITRDRLALINGDSGDNQIVSFQIEDILDNNGQVAGTKVDLSIRFQETYESRTEKQTTLKLTDNDQIYYR